MVAPPFGYHPATSELHADGESVTIPFTRALARRLGALVAIVAVAGVAFPVPALADGGQEVTLRGTVRKVIADDFARNRSKTTYFMETSAGRVPLVVPTGRVPEAVDGTTVTGRRLADGSVRVDTITPEAAPEARAGIGTDVADGASVLAATPWPGPAVRRIAVVVGTYTDLPQPPGSAGALMPALTGPTGSIKSLIEASSRGRVSVSATVYGPWALGIGSCETIDPFSATIDATEQQAAARGVSLASFDHVIMWTPAPCGGSWAALGEAPGTYIQTNAPYPDTPESRLHEFAWTVSHEMGHNMGLLHANALACEDAAGQPVSFGTSCESIEYGDPYSTMGGNQGYASGPSSWGFLSPLFSAEELSRLGWLDPAEVRNVTGSGTYDLVPLYGTGPGVRLLRIRRSTPVIADDPSTWPLRTGWLTIELRSGSPDGTWDTFPGGSAVASGVIVRYAEDGHEPTGYGVVPQHGPEYVVDAHPATVGRDSWDVGLLDTPLGVGDPVQLVDPATGYEIGLVSRTSDGASVTFTGDPPSVTALEAPVITSVEPAGAAMTVRWAEPAATAGLEVSGYTVRSYPAGRLCAAYATARSCLVPGLGVGVPYRFTVTATFDNPATGPLEGYWSTSDPSTAVTLPASPTAAITPLAVYRTTQSIAVRWSGS
ncbi:MAG: chitinase, partial [Chloroflexota bacterium]|nr:chitinase [Chloroflexota bacterium]